jgi:hypothetical protein
MAVAFLAFAVVAVYAVMQTSAFKTPQQAASHRASGQTAQATPAASVNALKAEDLLPMTCAQAWAAAGKRYPEMLSIVSTLAKVSLANRDLDFPNTKEAGWDAGTGIAGDCKADPQGLLFAIVDKHVRRVAEPADR